MALQVVVEDGTGLENSDTYIDLAYLRNYASMRGKALPVADDDAIPLLIGAMDYLEAKADEYIGTPTTDGQALAWPRTDMQSIPDPDPVIVFPQWQGEVGLTPVLLGVPGKIKEAQAALAIAIYGGADFGGVQDGKFITVEKLGPLETHYSEKLSLGEAAFPLVDKMLKPYLSNGDGGFSLTVGRG